LLAGPSSYYFFSLVGRCFLMFIDLVRVVLCVDTCI
jgi:hypothetical protein